MASHGPEEIGANRTQEGRAVQGRDVVCNSFSIGGKFHLIIASSVDDVIVELLDPAILLKFPLEITLLATGIIAIKTLVTTGAALTLGAPMCIAIITARCLAQIGEFSFVLLQVGITKFIHKSSTRYFWRHPLRP